MELAPISHQTSPINRVGREVIWQQRSLPKLTILHPYTSYREESITCRETTTGTFECISGNDQGSYGRSGYKGQMIDIWV